MFLKTINQADKKNIDEGEDECKAIKDYEHNICFAVVQDEFRKLVDAIERLKEKKELELKKREDDFLELFKSQMKLVQSEYTNLKGKIEEKENAIENHVFVKQLISEKTWYKNQALELHDEVTKMKKKVERLEEVEKDRKWLSDRLTTILKDKTPLDERSSSTTS